MADKDFLSQFSSGNKPDSFKEEERIKITKQRNPINIRVLLIVLLIIALIAGVLAFLFLRPTIEVEDFVGRSGNDVKAWIKQNEIETQGVVFKEEYNFDYDEGIVCYQSLQADKKIRKKTKMDFTISKGANPDELVRLPDIESMNKTELQTWIKDNKLSKTKIVTVYSDEVEANNVISYELKNVEASDFTRSSTLNITVSKGPQPAGTVVVPDFEKKLYTEVETWAKTNKVELKKVTSYSEKIDKDCVISQSVEAKKEMKEGETLTVYVSLGKAVYAPNFIGMTSTEANRWATKNGVYFYTDSVYSNAAVDTIIAQDIEEGKIISDDFTLTISLGKPDLSSATTYDELTSLVHDLNKKGAYINIGTVEYENSDTAPVNELIKTFGKVSIGSTLNPKVSKGKNIWLESSYVDEATSFIYSWDEARSQPYNEDKVRKLCELAGVNYEVRYASSDSVLAHNIISIKINGKDEINGGKYISESEVVVVTICDEYTGPEISE